MALPCSTTGTSWLSKQNRAAWAMPGGNSPFDEVNSLISLQNNEPEGGESQKRRVPRHILEDNISSGCFQAGLDRARLPQQPPPQSLQQETGKPR